MELSVGFLKLRLFLLQQQQTMLIKLFKEKVKAGVAELMETAYIYL